MDVFQMELILFWNMQQQPLRAEEIADFHQSPIWGILKLLK